MVANKCSKIGAVRHIGYLLRMVKLKRVYRFWYEAIRHDGIVAILCRGGDGRWRVFSAGLKLKREFGEHGTVGGAWERSCRLCSMD